MTEQKYGDRSAYYHSQDNMEAYIGCFPDTDQIVLTVKIADTYRYGCSHTIIHHETNLRNGYHNLIGSQSCTSQPAYHDSTQTE